MTKKMLQKKNSTLFLNQSNPKKLSIQFNLDGFSFCISDAVTQKDIFFSEYQFPESVISPEEILEEIKEIFKTDTYLQLDFSEVLVIHQNTLSSLVPNNYFNPNNLQNYLTHTIKILATDYITYDSLELLQIKNVYVPYVNINNYLFQNFGEFNYKHHSSILIEKLISKNSATETTMFVNVTKTTLDIVVLKENTLLFYNSFTYFSSEDFMYYVLFTAEQLQLNVEKFNLYFTGNIELNSEIYKITHQYIRNVYFLESDNAIFNDFTISKHSNFILLGV